MSNFIKTLGRFSVNEYLKLYTRHSNNGQIQIHMVANTKRQWISIDTRNATKHESSTVAPRQFINKLFLIQWRTTIDWKLSYYVAQLKSILKFEWNFMPSASDFRSAIKFCLMATWWMLNKDDDTAEWTYFIQVCHKRVVSLQKYSSI